MPLQTMLYASHRLEIEELKIFEQEITKLCGKEFVHQVEWDKKCIDENIRQNLNPIMPEEGQKVAKLYEIANSEGIVYHPSARSELVL
jgi:hypothetical protein